MTTHVWKATEGTIVSSQEMSVNVALDRATKSQLLFKYTFCDVLGHIISDLSWCQLAFSHIRHPLPGDPAGVDQFPACVEVAQPQPKIPLPDPQTPRGNFSCLCHLPNSPSPAGPCHAHYVLGPTEGLACKTLRGNVPQRPLYPTSKGSHLAHHPLLQHCSTNSEYLGLFLLFASSILSSQGVVRSRRMTCLVFAYNRTKSGLSDVFITDSGNLSCFTRSTLSSQSFAVVSIPEVECLATRDGFFPAWMKKMVLFFGPRCMQWLIP